jgi:peptidoglycan hydrolase-like protein with peptidoglycan-binding domain
MKISEICESLINERAVSADGALFDPNAEELNVGSSGPLVKAYQWGLTQLGYRPGSIDGQFGPMTKNVTVKYQKDNKIEADGVVGKSTYSLLNTDLEEKGIDEFPSGIGIKPKKSSLSIDPNKGSIGIKIPDLKNNSAVGGLEGKVLDWISQFESDGFYDKMYGGKRYPEILDMSLRELVAFQKKHINNLRKRGIRNATSAAGRYQFITSTLVATVKDMGLDPDNTKFSPKVQDEMIIHVLKKYRGLDRWLTGKLSTTAFLKNLSQEFASLPDPETGVSYYQGVGDNKAGTSTNKAIAQLTQIRKLA